MIEPMLSAIMYTIRSTILNNIRINHYLKLRAIVKNNVIDTEKVAANQDKVLGPLITRATMMMISIALNLE